MPFLSANRQLLFKAWRESRARFLLSAGTIAALCTTVVLFNVPMRNNPGSVPHGFKALTYNEHVYHFIYSGTAKGLFSFLVLFIGLGGLLRERSRGTAPFTLALPASRTQLILSQVLVGSLEVIAIAALPLLLIPALSPLVHESYPASVSLHFALLWIAGGLMIFGASFLCSVLFAGDYTALIVTFLVLFGIPLISRLPGVEELQVNFLMTMGEFGTMHWNSGHTQFLPSPMPWLRLLAYCGISAVFLWSALTATKRQDF
jgi:ABC-type transport system involved in multi-copper enzyme maturation permease subunit